jgi:hypothetical protein
MRKTTNGLGFYLQIKGFNFNEIYLFAEILHYKFDIICTIRNQESRLVLYIVYKSTKKFIEIIYLYIYI